MCTIFGFLNYGKKISHKVLTKLLGELFIVAEVRSIDATGISYVNDGKIVTFKKVKPVHKLNLYFPKNTTVIIGHIHFTTQGSAKQNYNNHPFESKTDSHTFSLAHNGVRIDLDGKLSGNRSESDESEYRQLDLYDDKDYENDLLLICSMYGVDSKDVEMLFDFGYSYSDLLESEISEIKALFEQCNIRRFLQ